MQSYVLVTAAFNEEAFIEKTILSVIGQTHRPTRWVIVSDGSTDRTDDIVTQYAARNEFMHLLRLVEDHPRNFAGQVSAINKGVASLKDVHYDFIGNLDADISLDPFYFDRLLQNFDRDPSLGVGGGLVHEKVRGGFKARRPRMLNSVAHAVQLFRRECYESIAGYVALPYGGPDTYAEVSARMKGWRVQVFPELPAYHHRPTGTAGSVVRYCFRQGLMDYSLGADSLFEVAKCLGRFQQAPYVVCGLARLGGFLWACFRREQRVAPKDFIEFWRAEQVDRLRNLRRKFCGKQANAQAPSTSGHRDL